MTVFNNFYNFGFSKAEIDLKEPVNSKNRSARQDLQIAQHEALYQLFIGVIDIEWQFGIPILVFFVATIVDKENLFIAIKC